MCLKRWVSRMTWPTVVYAWALGRFTNGEEVDYGHRPNRSNRRKTRERATLLNTYA